ncbi:MAG TPA: histidine phosphatase family protein [Caulobacteraceae bacterium]
MARDIYVVAHTQSRHHVEGLSGGWYDTELTELGRRQAEAVAGGLVGLVGEAGPVEIYASDLLRAAQTADPISRRLGTPAILWKDLRERNYGEAGGKPLAWAEARRVPAPSDGTRLDHRDGIEGVESMRRFVTRIYRAMGRVVASRCGTQIIVTHGFAMTYVVAAWIRMPLEATAWVNFRSSPGGITHLREDDLHLNRNVMRLNDTAHLAGA